MLCLDMKLITRFRSDKKNQQQGSSSNLLSPSGNGSPSTLEPPIPKRDRSKSLCVDRIGPLIQIEHKIRDDNTPPKHPNIFSRRRSTTTNL